ncbi:MAG: hypothetical protein IJQ38_04455 [Bacteroidaceae bacterium]|nr:hypothetical protein [Bacteroidaceae bacterium]
MSSRVPLLVHKSTTAGTRPHALLHRLTKQGVWGDTPCCIVPCTLLYRPLHPAASSPAPCGIVPWSSVLPSHFHQVWRFVLLR